MLNGKESHDYVFNAIKRARNAAEALNAPQVDLDALIDWCDTQTPVCTDVACTAARKKVKTKHHPKSIADGHTVATKTLEERLKTATFPLREENDPAANSPQKDEESQFEL